MLSPWFLAGLAAVGLPIFLHLLQQHRNTPVPFSSLMFFERRTQSSVKHRRLRYLLLLALRLALLALLVLAFAEPFVRRVESAVGAKQRMLLVIDESFSMRAGNRLAEARRKATGVLAARKPGDAAQVAALGHSLRLLTDPVADTNVLHAAVESVRPGDSLGSYSELTRAVRQLAQSGGQPIEVHLFSDMQKSAMPPGPADLALPSTVRLQIHPVASKPEPNWTVETVRAPAMLWDPKRARVQATVAGFETPAARRTVSLMVNGKTFATKAVDVPASGRATLEFQGLDAGYGVSRCEIRLDSADALPQDDRILFAVERSDPKRVLFIHEPRDTRSPLYFRAALASSAEGSFTLETLAADKAGNVEPGRFAFVVYSDVTAVPASLSQAVETFVRGGGGLWIALGASSARQSRIPIFEERVSVIRNYAREGERFSVVGSADATHPSLRRAGKWEGVRFFHAVRVETGSARVVARLSDQTPLLVEKKVGEGRVLVFTSAFDNVTNDFPLQPSFVPFVDQTARYLAGLEERGSTVQVNSFLELRSARERSIAVEIIDPDGKRPLSLAESTSAESFQVPREGFYELRRANGRHQTIAVNVDRRESALAPVPSEDLELWAASGGVPAANGNSHAGNAATVEQETAKPWSMWWYVMLLVLLAAMVESAIASRYLGVQREQEGP